MSRFPWFLVNVDLITGMNNCVCYTDTNWCSSTISINENQQNIFIDQTDDCSDSILVQRQKLISRQSKQRKSREKPIFISSIFVLEKCLIIIREIMSSVLSSSGSNYSDENKLIKNWWQRRKFAMINIKTKTKALKKKKRKLSGRRRKSTQSCSI